MISWFRVYGARGREVTFVTKKYFCDAGPKYFVINAKYTVIEIHTRPSG